MVAVANSFVMYFDVCVWIVIPDMLYRLDTNFPDNAASEDVCVFTQSLNEAVIYKVCSYNLLTIKIKKLTTRIF